MLDGKFVPNNIFQFYAGDELHDRQSANGNNKMRLQDPNLSIQPQRTVANLIGRRNAVGAAGIFAWETPADRREIDLRSNNSLVYAAELFEPAEECFSCGVRERPLQRRFPRTGRLPNDHYVA